MRYKWIAFLTGALTVLTLITGVLACANLLLVQSGSAPTERIALPGPQQQKEPAAAGSAEASAVAIETPATALPTQTGSGQGSIWVHDTEKTWSLDVPISIFRATYPGQGGKPTVVSDYGDKVIAPGTADTYDFIIENTGDASMNYILTAEGEASFTQGGQKYAIPIEARLSSYDGRYLAGSSDSWEALEALSAVRDEGTVAQEHFVKYSLEWQWPFEQEQLAEGDAYDTALGNLAAEGGELRAVIRLSVLAQQNPNPAAPGGVPKTGDNGHVGLWTALMVLSLIGLAALLIEKRRRA